MVKDWSSEDWRKYNEFKQEEAKQRFLNKNAFSPDRVRIALPVKPFSIVPGKPLR